MAGWPRTEGVSGSLLEGGLTGLLPLERRQLVDLLIASARQPFQNVFEISVGLDTVQPAVFDQLCSATRSGAAAMTGGRAR